jgi:hypothetical protein
MSIPEISFVKDIAEPRYNIPVSINAPTRAFDSPRSRLQAALARELYESGQRGKYIALNQDREEQIPDWIQQNAEKDTPVTREEIRNFVQLNLRSNLLEDG